MREHIDKVEYHHIELVDQQVVIVLSKFLTKLGVEHLVIRRAHIDAMAFQVLLQQLIFVLVFIALLVLVDPIAGIFALYLCRHKAGKHRVASKLGGGGYDAEE